MRLGRGRAIPCRLGAFLLSGRSPIATPPRPIPAEVGGMSTLTSSTRRYVTVQKQIGDKIISMETGRLAKQASGAVVVRLGDTMSLVATVSAPGREGLDFFPLTVDYREKVYAA